jgi:spore coat protein H
MNRLWIKVFFPFCLWGTLACVDVVEVPTDPASTSNTPPDYGIVFPQDKINTLEITLTKAAWDSIRADMVANAGFDFGAGPTRGGGFIPDSTHRPNGGGVPPAVGQPPIGGGNPPGGAAGSLDLIKGDPIWVEAQVKFESKEWKNVGFRLKGNSSLSQAWAAGVYKLPFKLEFDQFEDKIAAVKNQRFYGFKEFSMSPGQGDNSLMRDKIVSDLLRDAGVPAARTAFYKIYIDFGDGLKYCGVYTMVEVIDDSMVKNQFGEKTGNIYKPESNLTSFVEAQFEKKTNESAANFSDVKTFLSALNANTRTSDAVTWRANLEKSFDVNHFLKYLAINNSIVNWDAYGAMAHNYYLYTPKATGKLTWIPWDFNLSMGSSQPTSQQARGRGVSLEMTEVASNWPLIGFLADDPVYLAKYKVLVKEFNEKYLTVSRMTTIVDKEANLISAAVSQEVAPYSYLINTASFTTAVNQLKEHVSTRNKAVNAYLNK